MKKFRDIVTMLRTIMFLSLAQFGFRTRKSTCDALSRVVARINEYISKGGIAIAVSLDIKNALNSLPWPVIRDVLACNGCPEYLRRIIGNYLYERYIMYRL